MKLDEITHNIAAQLDSDGKEVKLAKVITDRTNPDTPEVGDTWIKKHNKNRFIVTKVTTTSVRLDMIDADGNPVPGHSGTRYHQESIKNLVANYRKHT